MIKLLVNLGATLVLVLLLAAPSVFSTNLVTFEEAKLSFDIKNNSEKFSDFLKLVEFKNTEVANFNLELVKYFDKPALYSGILEIENRQETTKIVKIVNYEPRVLIFFDVGRETEGPVEVKLDSHQKVEVNLLVPQNTQTKTLSFSLESN